MELPPFLAPVIVWDRQGATWSIVQEGEVMTATTISAPVFLETAATPPYLVSGTPCHATLSPLPNLLYDLIPVLSEHDFQHISKPW